MTLNDFIVGFFCQAHLALVIEMFLIHNKFRILNVFNMYVLVSCAEIKICRCLTQFGHNMLFGNRHELSRCLPHITLPIMMPIMVLER